MGSSAGFRRRPRRGSLQYWHRKKANRETPRIRVWNRISDVKLLGFAGYKAGMTHINFVDNRPKSPTKGEEIRVPVTILETPPINIFNIRLYSSDNYGKKVMAESFADNLDLKLAKRLDLPKQRANPEKLAELLSKASEVRVLAYTNPSETAIAKKKPDIMELAIGGKDVNAQFEYAKSILGTEVQIEDIFPESQLVDVHAVTTGKGFQGSVKRFGVSILHRKSHSDGRRKVATLGNWMAKTWRVPHPGQMGYHNRTEFSKQILKIGTAEETPVTPKGGFVKYGEVKGKYALLSGSLPGPKKRLVRLTFAKRRRSNVFPALDNVEISTIAQQR